MAVSTSCLCILLSPSISVPSLPLPSPLSFSPSSQLLQKSYNRPGCGTGAAGVRRRERIPARLGKGRGAALPGRWSPLGTRAGERGWGGGGVGVEETIDRAPARRPCEPAASRERGGPGMRGLPGPRSPRGNGAGGGRAGAGRPRDPCGGPCPALPCPGGARMGAGSLRTGGAGSRCSRAGAPRATAVPRGTFLLAWVARAEAPRRDRAQETTSVNYNRAAEPSRRVWGSDLERDGELWLFFSLPLPTRVVCPAGCNVCMRVEKSRGATWTPAEDFRIPRRI